MNLLLFLLACGGEAEDTKTDGDDADGDGVAAGVDCNDADASVHPGAEETWYDGVDQDCDGNDDDLDGDGAALEIDCDDADPTVYPGAGEVPDDGIDQDCDGADATSSGSSDADADGYATEVDCDDTDASVHPGAEETWYDGVDQDCDGLDDDQDGDGYVAGADCDDTDPSSNPGAGEIPDDGVDQDCDGEDLSSDGDGDGDGHLAEVDCDDADASVHPGAEETWYDGVDQDCDGSDDDQDADGFALADDCDDTDASVNPGAGEVPADGIDQDCDGSDATYPSTDDGDGDGYASWVDCDDADASVHPAATETWYDGVDQDCDGADDDQDGDGFDLADDCDDTDGSVFPGAGEVPVDGIDQDCDGADATWPSDDDADDDGYGAEVDCDDTDPDVHPDAVEVWYDGVDQDCDGADDDQDGDGHALADDCDDGDPDSWPGAPETAGDGVDQDCDGSDMLTVSDLGTGDLLITEIMKKPGLVADSYGEWIEIQNNSGQRVLLDGLVVSSEIEAISFTLGGGVELADGAQALLVREGDSSINGGLSGDYDYRSDFSLDDDADTLTLSQGAVTLDSVSYDDATFFPDERGAAMQLDPSYATSTKNDDGQVWCDGASSYGDGDLGTPGAANDACPDLDDVDGDGYVAAHDCDDSRSAIHPGAAESARDGTDSDCDGADFSGSSLRVGEIIVSEVMQNPDIPADNDGEWFEVYNASTYSINLLDMEVGDDTGVLFVVDEDIVLDPGDYAVFAASSDPDVNGGLSTVDFDYPASALGLGNGSDEIDLLNGSVLVDAVAWDNGSSFPDPTGASMALKPSRLSSSNNDVGANWCTSTSHINDDAALELGTPGEANDSC